MEFEKRLARIEAGQHFAMGMLMGIAQANRGNPELLNCIKHSLEQHHAALLAQTTDEVRLAAFQELLETVPGMTGSKPA
jgi:hypothetical protein